MPRLAQAVPKYRKHKASGQAIVGLDGRQYYLGPYGSKTSRDEYDRLIGEWLQNRRIVRPLHAETSGTLVVELVAAYLKFAKSYYRKAGRLTSEYSAILQAMRQLTPLYGRRPAYEFGPIALQAAMKRMERRLDPMLVRCGEHPPRPRLRKGVRPRLGEHDREKTFENRAPQNGEFTRTQQLNEWMAAAQDL